MAALGCATSLPPLPEQQVGAYKLGPGDEVQISVFRLDELSKSYVVSDTGNISVPLINQVSAADKTIAELETAIEKAIGEKNIIHNPDVTVQVAKYRPFFVVGEVQQPGQYEYQPRMTVLVALSIAGGPTFRAETDKVVITRRVGSEFIKGVARLDSHVLPGDTIEVKEGWF